MNGRLLAVLFLASLLALFVSWRNIDQPGLLSDYEALLFRPRGMAINYSGLWHWSLGDSYFDLVLTQDGEKIQGDYCMAVRNKIQMDCGPSKLSASLTDGADPSVRGTVIFGAAKISFRSHLTGEIGKALLRREGKDLVWRVTDAPVGESYILWEARLKAK
ncbi:MAG: hypothetical protein HY978_02930 [Candidatus Liptonbacteria bacterium]|nr:hypothetical protein [Candidatus Liptonbacteria bacterium]